MKATLKRGGVDEMLVQVWQRQGATDTSYPQRVRRENREVPTDAAGAVRESHAMWLLGAGCHKEELGSTSRDRPLWSHGLPAR